MGKGNLNIDGTQNDENQNNAMSDDDLRDGRRLSKNLQGKGTGPQPNPDAQDEDQLLAEFGRRGSRQR
jgi:hypothetical protein